MLLCLTAIAVIAVLYRFDPALNGFYPRCLFHQWTGLHCPACGSLRALHELAHGRLQTAMGLNPLLVLALPFLACAVASRFLRDGAPSTRSARCYRRGLSSAEPVLGAPTVGPMASGHSQAAHPFHATRVPSLPALFAKLNWPWVVAVVVLVFTLLRNIPLPPFTLLAP